MLTTFQGITEDALALIEEEKKVRKTNELFLLFAMGSQFDHLIKQALEKLGVFCLVADPASVTADDVRKLNPIGIIVSGGPASVHSEPPPFDNKIFDLGIPVFGICLGFQMWAKHVGAKVTPAVKREFGIGKATLFAASKLFKRCERVIDVLESHGDRVEFFGGLEMLAYTNNAPVAAAQRDHLYGVQFHPETTETAYGPQIFENFCFGICGAKDRYPAEEIAKKKIAEFREKIGGKRVLLALSGGSDSSTVAYLLKEASKGGIRPIGVYIKGIDRPDDETHVLKFFGNENWIELEIVDETETFLVALRGKISMSEKRDAMINVYRNVLEREIARCGASFIAQGTLYTDISESGGGYVSGARKARLKRHHNVGLKFSVSELIPLADCVKDGGRNIGRSIGVPEALLARHPFPGPGLVVRMEGEVTRERLSITRALDRIWIEELRKWNLYHTVWQAGAYLTDSDHACTKGDDAANGSIVMLWAVWSVNGFTARAAELPYDFLKHVDWRMGNEIRAVGATSYRLSGKPYATIEAG